MKQFFEMMTDLAINFVSAAAFAKISTAALAVGGTFYLLGTYLERVICG